MEEPAARALRTLAGKARPRKRKRRVRYSVGLLLPDCRLWTADCGLSVASRLHLEWGVGQLAEHFRCVQSLDPCRRQLEPAALVETHSVLDGEAPFRHD